MMRNDYFHRCNTETVNIEYLAKLPYIKELKECYGVMPEDVSEPLEDMSINELQNLIYMLECYAEAEAYGY